MLRKHTGMAVAALFAAFGLAAWGLRAEDQNEGQTVTVHVQRGDDGTVVVRKGQAKGQAHSAKGQEGHRRWGRGGQGRGFSHYRPQYFQNMVSRYLGQDIPVKINQLSFGPQKRFVTKVPVGGIENLDNYRAGWKVEDIYTLTGEQQKALDAVRDGYRAELKKLQKRLEEVNLAIAAQVKDLRAKFEARANDVLTGSAKTEKEKLDALAKEYFALYAKNAESVKQDADKLREEFNLALAAAREVGKAGKAGAGKEGGQGGQAAIFKLFGKAREMSQQLSGKNRVLAEQFAAKMKAAVSGEAKTKLDAAFQKQQNRAKAWRERAKRWQGQRQHKAQEKQKPAKPPKAPDNF